MKNLICIFLLFSLINFGCQKPGPGIKGPKCDGTPEHIYNPSAELTAVYFKEGSYWVYVDSSQVFPGYDSAIVTKFKNQFGKTDPSSCDSVQYINYEIQHWPQGPSEMFYVFFTSINKQPQCHECGLKVYRPYGTPEDEPTKYQRTYYDSLFIYDRYYKKVQVTTILDDPWENHCKVTYYMNSDFGFLRKDIYSTTNVLLKKLLLVRKNIIK